MTHRFTLNVLLNMSLLKKELEKEIFTLPPLARASLAERLLSSLDTTGQSAIDQKWAMEAEDRLKAYERGELEAVNASEVIARLEKKYS